MKKMKCEICDSISILKTGDDLFTCQNCGVQYSKAEAIKLLTEVDDAVYAVPAETCEDDSITPSAKAEDLDDLSTVTTSKKAVFCQYEPRLSPDAALKIENAALSGQKLDAIKVYREETGATLQEAKDAIEKLTYGR